MTTQKIKCRPVHATHKGSRIGANRLLFDEHGNFWACWSATLFGDGSFMRSDDRGRRFGYVHRETNQHPCLNLWSDEIFALYEFTHTLYGGYTCTRPWPYKCVVPLLHGEVQRYLKNLVDGWGYNRTNDSRFNFPIDFRGLPYGVVADYSSPHAPRLFMT